MQNVTMRKIIQISIRIRKHQTFVINAQSSSANNFFTFFTLRVIFDKYFSNITLSF